MAPNWLFYGKNLPPLPVRWSLFNKLITVFNLMWHRKSQMVESLSSSTAYCFFWYLFPLIHALYSSHAVLHLISGTHHICVSLLLSILFFLIENYSFLPFTQLTLTIWDLLNHLIHCVSFLTCLLLHLIFFFILEFNTYVWCLIYLSLLLDCDFNIGPNKWQMFKRCLLNECI